MKIVEDMPSGGQFVRVWVHDGLVWCETTRFSDGILEALDEERNEWFEDFESRTKYTMPNSKFVVGI